MSAAHGAPLQNHWWLSQLAFFALWSTGGPFLLTAFAGACAVASIFLCWRLLRGPWELRIVLLLWLMVATAPEWSVRPQVVSLVLLAAVAHLIARDRLVWLPLVCVAWANAHALVVFGVAMAGASLMEAVVWSRTELKRATAVALACVAAPLVSPLGWNYWPQVLSTVGTSRALQIQEYRFPSSPEDLPFWLAAGLLVVLVSMERHSLAQRSRADRTLLIGSLVLAVASMGASRNIAFFAVMAAPAISRLWPMPKTVRRSAAPRTIHAGAFAVALAVASLVGATVVSVRWRDAGASLGWQPMSAATVKAISLCPDPLFNEMQDGGPLMWNLPGRRVFVDSRMEAYPVDLLRSSRTSISVAIMRRFSRGTDSSVPSPRPDHGCTIGSLTILRW